MKKKILSLSLGLIISFSTFGIANAETREDICAYRTEDALSYNENIGKRYNDFDSVIVVNAYSIDSDGLSASGLVGAANGVICPIVNGEGAEVVEKYLNGDTYKTVYFIGGPDVISNNLKREIADMGYSCKSIYGKNRIETSYKVAEEIERLTGNVNEIAITRAYKGEADAANISFEARNRKMPIILTNGQSVPFNTDGVTTYAIGGTSVISNSLVNSTGAIRIGGSNRYETNRKVIEYFNRTENSEYTLVFGHDVTYAILSSCIKDGSPVVLISENSNKDILYGANRLKYVFFFAEDLSYYIRAACSNATYAKGAVDAMNAIYRQTGDSRKNTFYMYNQYNSYVSALDNFEYYNKNFYIFNIVDDLGDEADSNFLVRKSDKKLFVYSPGMSKPIAY